MFYVDITLVSIIKIFLTLLNIEKHNWGRRGMNVLMENTSSENALNVPFFFNIQINKTRLPGVSDIILSHIVEYRPVVSNRP
jgi:hypothetical protein